MHTIDPELKWERINWYIRFMVEILPTRATWAAAELDIYDKHFRQSIF